MFDAPLRLVTLEEAELIKNGANAFLALKISFANEIAGLAERAGRRRRPGARRDRPRPADRHDVSPPELRVRRQLPAQGAPDDRHLRARARARRCTSRRPRAEANLAHQRQFAERIDDIVGGVAGRRIALLGLAFKAGTDDIRSSPAVRAGPLAPRARRASSTPTTRRPWTVPSAALPGAHVHETALEALDGRRRRGDRDGVARVRERSTGVGALRDGRRRRSWTGGDCSIPRRCATSGFAYAACGVAVRGGRGKDGLTASDGAAAAAARPWSAGPPADRAAPPAGQRVACALRAPRRRRRRSASRRSAAATAAGSSRRAGSTADWICYCGGVGEDITFDLGLIERVRVRRSSPSTRRRARSPTWPTHAAAEPRFHFLAGRPVVGGHDAPLLRPAQPGARVALGRQPAADRDLLRGAMSGACRASCASSATTGSTCSSSTSRAPSTGSSGRCSRPGSARPSLCLEIDQPVRPWTFWRTVRRIRSAPATPSSRSTTGT